MLVFQTYHMILFDEAKTGSSYFFLLNLDLARSVFQLNRKYFFGVFFFELKCQHHACSVI